MESLRVRVYNVRFGDAILVTVPDRSADGTVVKRHILIDVGNVLGGTNEGGADTVFAPVIDDILAELQGRPIDLYVMTHEHMDHVQGLLYAAKRLGKELQIDYAWLTASAAPDYYQNHTQAREKRREARKVYLGIQRFLAASPAAERDPFEILLLNNNILAADDEAAVPGDNPYSSTDCVHYLRQRTPNTTYVYRGCPIDGKHPFQEARFELWAPEEDSAIYYGRFQPLAIGEESADAGAAIDPAALTPPAGVDAGAFYKLVQMRRLGIADNLLQIDKAANNTSVVFYLEWRGWKLLFAGDAEIRSWREMRKQQVLKPVHFLKVSHHGSHNGTPLEMLDLLMPLPAPDNRQRYAVISTCEGVYSGVPYDKISTALHEHRAEVRSIIDTDSEQRALYADGAALDIIFEG